MNNFIELVFLTSIVINAIAGVFITAFVIPLQVEQAGVKNGLVKLRKQMLIKGVLSLMVITASILVLTIALIKPNIDIMTFFVGGFILIHAIGILGKAYLDYKIYHQQYSPESKQMHERIDNLEKGDRRRAKHKASA